MNIQIEAEESSLTKWVTCPRCGQPGKTAIDPKPRMPYLSVYCERCSAGYAGYGKRGPFNNFKECVRRARQEVK